MHTNVILTNRRRIHTQPNYPDTKLKAWFRRLLRHPARKRTGSILNRHTPPRTHTGEAVQQAVQHVVYFVVCFGLAIE